ncbi:hypothetical protein Rhow_005003 [Rhodococcus wratislaviensis]|uniref:Uncharacterized protein n=1 Tax=Rhodococcus wratislaviensis TaxID=44752 RepID=A0A402CCJ5_RHOWR|nr:hypothetical protein Rhow_005003 [Rhodococcus wratislaviensis]
MTSLPDHPLFPGSASTQSVVGGTTADADSGAVAAGNLPP